MKTKRSVSPPPLIYVPLSLGGGTILMALALVVRSTLGYWILEAAFLVGAVVLYYGLRGRGQRRTSLLDLAPALLAAFAFLAYSVALIHVQQHAAESQLHEAKAYDKYVDRLQKADDKLTAAALKRVDSLSPAQLEKHKHALQQALKGKGTAGIALAISKGIRARKALDRGYAGYRTHPPPTFGALPAWFQQLGGFFSLAAQLLAALIVALVFAQRPLRRRSRPEFVAAMLLGLLGLAAAIVGCLPDTHRGLNAFLLGYVLAGFASTVVTLGLLLREYASGPPPRRPSGGWTGRGRRRYRVL